MTDNWIAFLNKNPTVKTSWNNGILVYYTSPKVCYKFIAFFEAEPLKKIQPIGEQYGQNYRPTSKHQYDDCITWLNFSAILQ